MIARRHVLLSALHATFALAAAFPSLLPVVVPVCARLQTALRALEDDLYQVASTPTTLPN